MSAASSIGLNLFPVVSIFKDFAISLSSPTFGVINLMAGQYGVSKGFLHTAMSVGSKKTEIKSRLLKKNVY